MAEDAKSVAEQVQEHLNRWNPAPQDNSMARLVGDHPPPGDTRATGHGDPVDYGDDVDDVDDLKGKALDEALERRGLSKSGTADEKRERIREYDESDEDEDDEDDEE
jgi:hypothetical protein